MNYVYEIFNDGEYKFLREVEEIFTNSVRFTNQSTSQKFIIREVDDWISLDEFKPTQEVIALNDKEEMIIFVKMIVKFWKM
jgi:hypothetical protein